MLKGNDKAKPFLDMLTTSTIGSILPQFKEEYGDNKKIDLSISASHDLFTDGLPGSKMSGIYIDKNGNWKIQLNLNVNLLAQTSGSNYKPIRNCYVTVVFKMRIKQDDSNPFNKKLSLTPRSLEISQFKVMKETEEMTAEQMML